MHLLPLWHALALITGGGMTVMASAEPLTFGLLLKHSRRAAGLTQEALAARAGYSATYISMLEERGERRPKGPQPSCWARPLG